MYPVGPAHAGVCDSFPEKHLKEVELSSHEARTYVVCYLFLNLKKSTLKIPPDFVYRE